MALKLQISDSMSNIDSSSWDALAGNVPLLSHAFLSALESSGSVGAESGWQPSPIFVFDNDLLVGAMPLYIKSHSYGEYVFDWAWADAYARNGMAYYPKLLCAIPFTPITSARLLSDRPDIQALLVQALTQTMQQNQLSSAHVLFPDASSAAALHEAGWLKRTGVQFRWHNNSYINFDAFLSTLSHDKRKKIRQERNKVVASGVVCQRIQGADVTPEQWEFFYKCYQNTYLEHRSTPYLTFDFFLSIAQSMPQHILLILAYRDNQPVAAALNIYDATALYGRYWGALEYIPNLHFELCYYQAQEFCIAENIEFFEGGAQGEHKLARGFKARPTCSFHQIAHPEFAKAIAEFVTRESEGVAAYADELEQRAPFKSGATN
jgi:predicted N-acyltransferase